MKSKPWIRALSGVACALALTGLVDRASADPSCGHDHEDEDRPDIRATAAKRIAWKKKGPRPPRLQGVQILGFNDFHGQLSAGRFVAGRPVGSAAVMASYLKAEEVAFDGRTVIAHAGDFVGASPAASALLQDEPSIQFLNLLGNKHCKRTNDMHKKCNVIGTLGNHEFDEGVDEMLRLLDGGNHPNGPFLERQYSGAHFPYVSANVVDTDSGQPILPPYVVQQLGKARVAFIGAVLEGTPLIVTPTGVEGLSFLDEAESINKYIPEIQAKGVEAIVVLIHQGGRQTTYTGPTSPTAGAINGEIVDIVARLDGAVDVVVSGHSHSFSNGLLPNAAGEPTLVTQAFSASTAYGDIELQIDLESGDIVEKSAAIVTTWADEGPGLTPVAEVAELTAAAEALVAPLVNEEVGVAAADITRTQNAAGESALGNLIADAQRASVDADVAFMNPGGIRENFSAGSVTWGEVFTVQPFGNTVTSLNMTGAQIRALLEQQFVVNRILQISGLTYTWDSTAPVGSRVVSVQIGGAPLDPAAVYSVAANNFIVTGGDGFSVFLQGTNQTGGPVDIDALIDYLQTLTQPFNAVIEGRITRL